MTALMQRSIEDAIRYVNGLHDALEQISELRDEGEQPPLADLKRIESLVEDCAMHEALAEAGLRGKCHL